MPIANRIPALVAAVLILATSSSAHAEGLVVRAADTRGVTLELSLPQWSLSAPAQDGLEAHLDRLVREIVFQLKAAAGG